MCMVCFSTTPCCKPDGSLKRPPRAHAGRVHQPPFSSMRVKNISMFHSSDELDVERDLRQLCPHQPAGQVYNRPGNDLGALTTDRGRLVSSQLEQSVWLDSCLFWVTIPLFESSARLSMQYVEPRNQAQASSPQSPSRAAYPNHPWSRNQSSFRSWPLCSSRHAALGGTQASIIVLFRPFPWPSATLGLPRGIRGTRLPAAAPI
jgi:hypothetical protein